MKKMSCFSKGEIMSQKMMNYEEIYRSIEEENYQESPVQNVFDIPTKGILLPWNLRMSWKKENNLLFYIAAFGLGYQVADIGVLLC